MLISGHESLRLQKANEGRSSGAGAGWTGDRGCRKEPCRLGSIDCDDSWPLDDVRLNEPANGAVAVGDGTFFIRCRVFLKGFRERERRASWEEKFINSESFDYLPLWEILKNVEMLCFPKQQEMGGWERRDKNLRWTQKSSLFDAEKKSFSTNKQRSAQRDNNESVLGSSTTFFSALSELCFRKNWKILMFLVPFSSILQEIVRIAEAFFNRQFN